MIDGGRYLITVTPVCRKPRSSRTRGERDERKVERGKREGIREAGANRLRRKEVVHHHPKGQRAGRKEGAEGQNGNDRRKERRKVERKGKERKEGRNEDEGKSVAPAI